jgi:intraflagellar transport protein 122
MSTVVSYQTAHQNTVYTVSFSSDGTRFASGGADNMVVIWKSNGQGLLRYSHGASIQKVKYNPSMLLLASCSEVSI